MKKKVCIYSNSADIPVFQQYVDPEDVDNLLAETKHVRSELAQFVNGECVYSGRLSKEAIESIRLALHYEIN